MARVHPIQTNFTRGEISPRVFGQIDFKGYPNSLETFDMTHGPLVMCSTPPDI